MRVYIKHQIFESFEDIMNSNPIEQYMVVNKTIDIPLLFDNSEEFFYELEVRKIIDEMPIKEVYEILKNKES